MVPENKDAEKILEICSRLGWRIACAESLTGGLLADAFVSVSGASGAFAGSLVVYDSAEKEKILGVGGEILKRRGAVEEEVALEMARGAGRIFSLSCASPFLLLSTTGVAGPSSDGFKPVGTVCCAVIAPSFEPLLQTFRFSGGREEIRRRTVFAILKSALGLLSDSLLE
ncbi:MAG: CinA family protein [Aeriscardovia sp.]|nr:CinA family protein [Aeriscardovia sp.]